MNFTRANFLNYVATHEADFIHVSELANYALAEPLQIPIWLRSAHSALIMHENEEYALTSGDEAQLRLVRDSEGNSRYSRKVVIMSHGRPQLEATFAEGLHQCLAEKSNLFGNHRDAFILEPENFTARTIYPITFMQPYAAGVICGVSGNASRS